MNCIFYCFFHNSLHPLECWSLPIQQLFLSTRTPIVDNANTCTQERKEKQRTKGMSIRLFMKFSTTKTQATQATQATELNPTQPTNNLPWCIKFNQPYTVSYQTSIPQLFRQLSDQTMPRVKIPFILFTTVFVFPK